MSTGVIPNIQNDFPTVMGAHFSFKPDDDGSTTYAWRKIGMLSELPQQEMNIETADRKILSLDGILLPGTKQAVSADESWVVTTENMKEENFAMAFGALDSNSVTRAASAVTNAASGFKVGDYLCILDANGDRITNITSIQEIEVQTGSPYAMVVDEDYIVNEHALLTGFIPTLAGGATNSHTAGDEFDVHVDYTPEAISGAREIIPMSKPLFTGYGHFVWGNAKGDLWERKIYCSINREALNNQQGSHTSAAFRISTLRDPAAPSKPYGSWIKTKGALI